MGGEVILQSGKTAAMKEGLIQIASTREISILLFFLPLKLFLLDFFGWKVKCLGSVFKVCLVRTITKWFVSRPTAPAKRYNCPALQTIRISVYVDYFKVTIHFE